MPDIELPAWMRLGKRCTQQDNYERKVEFALEDVHGGERSSEPAIAKFDTGCDVSGLISKEFANGGREGKLGNFKSSNDVKKEQARTGGRTSTEADRLSGQHAEKRSIWKSFKDWLRQLNPKPTGKKSLPDLVTVNGEAIAVVGILSDTRWRGVNLGQDMPGQMIRFENKFIRDPPYNEFLVVEGLQWDVVFGLPTIHHLQNPGCGHLHAAGAVVKSPNDTGDRESQIKGAKEQREWEKEMKRKKKEAAKKENKTNQTPKDIEQSD